MCKKITAGCRVGHHPSSWASTGSRGCLALIINLTKSGISCGDGVGEGLSGSGELCVLIVPWSEKTHHSEQRPLGLGPSLPEGRKEAEPRGLRSYVGLGAELRSSCFLGHHFTTGPTTKPHFLGINCHHTPSSGLHPACQGHGGHQAQRQNKAQASFHSPGAPSFTPAGQGREPAGTWGHGQCLWCLTCPGSSAGCRSQQG